MPILIDSSLSLCDYGRMIHIKSVENEVERGLNNQEESGFL